jgi:hypothetical protein
MFLERWPCLPTGHNPKERVQAGTGSCYDRKSFDELLATDPVRLTDRELDRLQRALTCVESPASGVRREVFHVGHQPLAPGGLGVAIDARARDWLPGSRPDRHRCASSGGTHRGGWRNGGCRRRCQAGRNRRHDRDSSAGASVRCRPVSELPDATQARGSGGRCDGRELQLADNAWLVR